MKLSDKITNQDEYFRIRWETAGITWTTQQFLTGGKINVSTLGMQSAAFVQYVANSSNVPAMAPPRHIDVSLWWMHRELVREFADVYQKATSALTFVRSLAQFAVYLPHISREEPDKIAYTASAEDGKSDRQVRIAFGRFLRKFDPLMSDKTIAAIEAWHRSELNPEVDLLPFDSEFANIKSIYMNITSCMSKSDTSFGTGKTGHPLKSYCAPGFHLAALKNATGSYSARCIVWINPEDPTDKRAVRVYGDVVLSTWLKRNGFKFRSFHGAWLHTPRVNPTAEEDGAGRYAIRMPYVDVGTGLEAVNDTNAAGVWDGVERTYIVSSKHKATIPATHLIGIQTQHGYTTARPFVVECEDIVTGKRINCISETVSHVFHEGKLGYTKKVESGWRPVCVLDNTYVFDVYAAPTVPTFVHNSRSYIDRREEREHCGFYKLDPTLYPDEQDWGTRDSMVLTEYKTRIKTEDCVYFITKDKAKVRRHRTQIPSDAIRVAQLDDNTKAWAHPEVEIVQTAANRKVVPGVHAVKQAYDGTWHYTRNLTPVDAWGSVVYIYGDATAAQVTAKPPLQIANRIQDAARDGSESELKRLIFKVLNDRGDCLAYVEDGAMCYVMEPRAISLAATRAAVANEPAATLNDARKAQHAKLRTVLSIYDSFRAAQAATASVAQAATASVAQAA